MTLRCLYRQQKAFYRMKISIRVVPNAKKEKIVENGATVKVYVNAPALEGRANKKVIELLAEHYGVKKYNIIVRGEVQRDKVVEVNL